MYSQRVVNKWFMWPVCVFLLSHVVVRAQPYVVIDTAADWQKALDGGAVVPMNPMEWSGYMDDWLMFGEGEPYPPNSFFSPEPPTGSLYVYEGGVIPEYPSDAGLVMVWGDDPPFGSTSSAWKYAFGHGQQRQAIVNLTNTMITITVTAPQFDPINGNQINAVSFGIQDVNGVYRSWQWSVGPLPAPIQWNIPTPITINTNLMGVGATTPVASGFMNGAGFNIMQSQFLVVDENGVWVGGSTPVPPMGMMIGMWNYWHNLVIAPGGGASINHGPVSFSMNGFMQATPGYDGLPVPGSQYFNWPWLPPPPPGVGPYGTTRIPPTPQPVGIATVRPGDVNDYFVSGSIPEAEIFQSEPDLGIAGPPAGTNNQILQAVAMGLSPGGDNINAYTFGEDYFNGNEDPQWNDPMWDEVYAEPWEGRAGAPPFIEPIVAGGGMPITFYFSVDPFAIGAVGAALQVEATVGGIFTLPAGPATSADSGGGAGPWRSNGEAAGDVFFASPITAPGINFLDHDDVTMALMAPSMTMEDDLDALEHVGTNAAGEPGNTHDRVVQIAGAPDLGDPNNSVHDPSNVFPVVFSVCRGSYGVPGSAVSAQVNNPDEGASGDLFVAVKITAGLFAGANSNMLLIDEGQLALMPHDDLDAVILKILIPAQELEARILDANQNYNPESMAGSSGFGFTMPLLAPGEAAVGFSVDIGSIGLLFSAVDFETRVDGGFLPPIGSGVVEQAGDIFYSNLMPAIGQMVADMGTGLFFGQNYLWFEEAAIGLDKGAWSFLPGGPSGNLADAPDELNALDSISEESPSEACCLQPDLTGGPTCLFVSADDCINIHNGSPMGPGSICTVDLACCLQDGSGQCVNADQICCGLYGTPSPTNAPVCLSDVSGDGVDDACQVLDVVVCEPQSVIAEMHPPFYWYDVSPDPTFGRCDFHVRVDDFNPNNYTNATITPWPGNSWNFMVHQPDGINWWASWWSAGCADALFGPGTWRFSYNNTNSSTWGHWRTTIDGSSDPDAQVVDRSENHPAEMDGFGYRVHVPLRSPDMDFGDAPELSVTMATTLANNGARHVLLANVFMGALIDSELDGQPSAGADGDDLNNLNDEDGVIFTSALVPGQPGSIAVTASVSGFLSAWIDFNQDGVWGDTIEKIFFGQPLNPGVNNLSFAVPSGVSSGQAYARFRFTTTGSLSYQGMADDGEVEDYRVNITTAQPLACCLPDGNCVVIPYDDCVAQGGDPQVGELDCVGVVCHIIKWAQPPTFNPASPLPDCYWGWDELSIYELGPHIVADDWSCDNDMPIVNIHWWGSYPGWIDPIPPPIGGPDMFHIGIWTDVPAGVDRPWSHPDAMVESLWVPRDQLNERSVGCDFHPDMGAQMDTCFRYDFSSSEPLFRQSDPACTVYWISIAAWYANPGELIPWGWKTRRPEWNDDAIRILQPLAPEMNPFFIDGVPIEDGQGQSWDMAFVMTSKEVLPPELLTGEPGFSKDRYVSFNPTTNGTNAVATRVSRIGGTDKFVDCTSLTDLGPDGWYAVLIDGPLPIPGDAKYYCDLSGVATGLHVRGCSVVPGNMYDVAMAIDGSTFSSTLSIPTTPPQFGAGRQQGDTVGGLVGGVWTAPDGLNTASDIVAAVQKFSLVASAAITARIDTDGAVPNGIISGGDILRAVSGFAGTPFGYSVTGCLTGTCVPPAGSCE